MNGRARFSLSLATLALALVAATNQPPQDSPADSTQAIAQIELRGRVVCLPEEMHRLYQAALPSTHEHIYGFKTEDGKSYTLLRTKYSEALFADQRFREKQLLLEGRLFPKTQIFEPTIIRSIRNGLVCDLYYYCDVCDIQAVAPGPCECCQGPTELVEKQLENH